MNETLSNYDCIYIRLHESYEKYDACKLGKSMNIYNRHYTYMTSEIKRGKFILIFRCSFNDNVYNLNKLEKDLITSFRKYNIFKDGGKEFFSINIIELIEEEIEKLSLEYNFDFTKMEEDEIQRVNTYDFNKCEDEEEQTLEHNSIIPRDYQIDIINDSIRYFENEPKGILNLPCGVGKTFISLFIINKLNFKRILIFVPSIPLTDQWIREVKRISTIKSENIQLFDSRNREIIKSILKEDKEYIIICTYHSSENLRIFLNELNVKPEIKILDEVHHLASIKDEKSIEKENKTYSKCLQIQTEKQLGLTATLKFIKETPYSYSSSSSKIVCISNDNKEIFGDVITERSLNWAIEKNIICDYILQTIFINTSNADYESYYEEYDITNDEDKKLFLSAYFSLKSVNDNHTNHLLIYSNKMENSNKITSYINKLRKEDVFTNVNELFCGSYNSFNTKKEQIDILEKFESSKKGIINCVYCLGEGWDFPLLDGVVFAENMTSEIRIVQSALRASRKNKNNESKIAKILLPIFTDRIYKGIDEIAQSNNGESNTFRNVLRVINQMNLVDENIIQKITCNFENYTKGGGRRVFETDEEKSENKDFEIEDLTDELNKFKNYILQNIRRDDTISYNKIKEILRTITPRIDSKESYYSLCKRDTRFREDPQEYYKEQFTNWLDYLGIEREYYDLNKCNSKIVEYLNYENIKVSKFNIIEVAKYIQNKDKKFPPCDLWKQDTYDIITNFSKKKRNVYKFK